MHVRAYVFRLLVRGHNERNTLSWSFPDGHFSFQLGFLPLCKSDARDLNFGSSPAAAVLIEAAGRSRLLYYYFTLAGRLTRGFVC